MKHNRHWLTLILTISVLLRIGVAFYLGDVVDAPPLMTDQRSYHALGARLLEGYGYSFDQPWYPFTPPETPTAHWSFLYPLFVAAVYALFGVHPLAVRLVQAVLGGVLLPWMVYRLTYRLFETRGQGDKETRRQFPPLPLMATAIAALYAYFILYAATLMTETFFIVAVLWSLEVSLRLGSHLREGSKVPRSLALQLGLSLGIAALLRQSILPWVPVLFLWLLWQARRGKRWGAAVGSLALAGLVLAACILPWTVRNWRVYGQFLLLNSNTGYAMYSAQHPMHGTNFQEFAAAPLPEGWGGRPEPEMDRDLMRLGLQFVLDDPVRYLLLSLSRARAFFEFWPTPDTVPLHNLGRTGSFGLLLPFMLYGLYLGIRHSTFDIPDSRFQISLLLLFAAFYTVLHLLTWAMVRYRLPVDAMLLPFAALALQDLYHRGRHRLAGRRLPVPGGE
jgi:hypothetical protein